VCTLTWRAQKALEADRVKSSQEFEIWRRLGSEARIHADHATPGLVNSVLIAATKVTEVDDPGGSRKNMCTCNCVVSRSVEMCEGR